MIKVWPSLQGGLQYSKGLAACQKFLKKLQRLQDTGLWMGLEILFNRLEVPILK